MRVAHNRRRFVLHNWMERPAILTTGVVIPDLWQVSKSSLNRPLGPTRVVHRPVLMQDPVLILAPASEIRAKLLRQAGIRFEQRPVRIDESAIRDAFLAEGASPRDLADALAEMKALRLRDTGTLLVLGSDQVLDYEGRVYSKPETPEDAMDHLRQLSGKQHHLYSAAAVCQQGAPVWRHVGHVRMTMHPLSEAFIQDYVSRNWDSIRHAVGCYKLEEEGVRLFARIEGDYFSILGLPLIELLTWLRARGDIIT